MTKRWLSEEQLSQLPPRMTVRALGKPTPKKTSARKASTAAPARITTGAAEPTSAKTPLERMQALGRLPVGEMNKTEAAYAQHLEELKLAGEVVWYKFEGIKLRLADNTFYSPDFLVMTATRALEVHEVKGHWTDDARVKIKVAAAIYPIFRFIAIKKANKADGGGWKSEIF